MSTVAANGISLAYESFGDPAAPPVILIMGLGGQMIHWHTHFCGLLAARGLRVIRFDNRDTGRSTVMGRAGAINLQTLIQAWGLHQPIKPPYTLLDMAGDVVGLMDALGLERAHMVGMSMGGMIAQVMAIHHPERLLTLTSIMSAPGGPGYPAPDPASTMALLTPAPADREGFAARALALGKVLNAGAWPLDEEKVLDMGRQAFDRGYSSAGVVRQFAAVLAAGSRLEALKSVTAPTLAIHGELDPLIPVSGGRDVAAAVPGGRFAGIPKMGHYLPPQVWGVLIENIAGHLNR